MDVAHEPVADGQLPDQLDASTRGGDVAGDLPDVLIPRVTAAGFRPKDVGEGGPGSLDARAGDGLPREVRAEEELRIVDELPQPLQLAEGRVGL